MDFELSLITSINSGDGKIAAILGCNKALSRYGISLSEEDALALAACCESSVRENGRIEVGTGITDRLLKTFCHSAYIAADEFADTICELTEIFYYFKSDMLELADDDELTEYMYEAFEQRCRGSLTVLADTELPKISDNLRAGLPPFYEEPEELDGDEECEEDTYE